MYYTKEDLDSLIIFESVLLFWISILSFKKQNIGEEKSVKNFDLPKRRSFKARCLYYFQNFLNWQPTKVFQRFSIRKFIIEQRPTGSGRDLREGRKVGDGEKLWWGRIGLKSLLEAERVVAIDKVQWWIHTIVQRIIENKV